VNPETITWLLIGWLCGSLVTTWILSRVFRYQRDREPSETPWEPTVLDHEVEVRWKNGQVESRFKH
jgi:hypothetical protein